MSTALQRAALLAAALVVISATALFAACGNDKKSTPDATDAEYQAYFAQMAPALDTLAQQIPTLDTSGNAQRAALAATLRTYDDALDTFATAIDKIKAPGQAAAPHGNFSKQSRAIAKAFDVIQAALSSASHTPTSDDLTLSLRNSGAIVQWVAACARLQGLARTKGVPAADFQCASTLGLGATGGS